MLGPESPLCHLGATQVGVCAERQAWLGRERSILGQTQEWGVLLGGEAMEWAWEAGVPGSPQESVVLPEGRRPRPEEKSRVGLGPASPGTLTSAPRCCCGSRAGSSWSSTGPGDAPRPCSARTLACTPASPASASAASSCRGCRRGREGFRPGLQGWRETGGLLQVLGRGVGKVGPQGNLPAPGVILSASPCNLCLNTPRDKKLTICSGHLNLSVF